MTTTTTTTTPSVLLSCPFRVPNLPTGVEGRCQRRTPGDVCALQCSEGFTQTSSSSGSARCNADESWEIDAVPACTRRVCGDCSELDLAEDAVVSSSGDDFENTCILTCRDGLMGRPLELVCAADGLWTATDVLYTSLQCADVECTTSVDFSAGSTLTQVMEGRMEGPISRLARGLAFAPKAGMVCSRPFLLLRSTIVWAWLARSVPSLTSSVPLAQPGSRVVRRLTSFAAHQVLEMVEFACLPPPPSPPPCRLQRNSCISPSSEPTSNSASSSHQVTGRAVSSTVVPAG